MSIAMPTPVASAGNRPRLAPRVDRARRRTTAAPASDDANAQLALATGANEEATTAAAVVAASTSVAAASASIVEAASLPSVESLAATPDLAASSASPSFVCPACNVADLLEYEASIGLFLCSGCGRIGGDSSSTPLDEEVEWSDGGRPIGSYVSHTHAQSALSQTARGLRGTGGVHVHAAIQKSSARGDLSYDVQLEHRRVTTFVHACLTNLHLPHASFVSRVHHLLRTATKGRYGDGPATRALVAASIYVLCRQEHRPLSLIDIACVVPLNIFQLGRIVSGVCRANGIHLGSALDPSIFVERLLGQAQAKDDTCDTALLATMRHEMNALLKLAHHEWLDTGRAPAALCGAAASMVFAAHEVHFSRATIAELLHTTVKTIGQRSDELHAKLRHLVRQHLPWLLADDGLALDDATALVQFEPTSNHRSNKRSRVQQTLATRIADVHLPFVMEHLDMLMQLHAAEANELTALSNEATSSTDVTPSPASLDVFPPAPSSDLVSPCSSRASSISPCDSTLSSVSAATIATGDIAAAAAPLAILPSDPPSYKRSASERLARTHLVHSVLQQLFASAPTELSHEHKNGTGVDDSHLIAMLLRRGVLVEALCEHQGSFRDFLPTKASAAVPPLLSNAEAVMPSSHLRDILGNGAEEEFDIDADGELEQYIRTPDERAQIERLVDAMPSQDVVKRAPAPKRRKIAPAV